MRYLRCPQGFLHCSSSLPRLLQSTLSIKSLLRQALHLPCKFPASLAQTSRFGRFFAQTLHTAAWYDKHTRLHLLGFRVGCQGHDFSASSALCCVELNQAIRFLRSGGEEARAILIRYLILLCRVYLGSTYWYIFLWGFTKLFASSVARARERAWHILGPETVIGFSASRIIGFNF